MMRKKKKSASFYLSIFGGLFLFLCIFLGIHFMGSRMAKGKEETRQHEVVAEKNSDERMDKEIELLYFQEENLSFISRNLSEKFKQKFSEYIKATVKKGDATCCVVLGNIQRLSRNTYMVYLQTNEPFCNIYQVILNENEQFFDIQKCEKEIADIEVYGGVKEDDNIESIYIYGEKEPLKEVEVPTLEEEEQIKSEEYLQTEKNEKEKNEDSTRKNP